KAIKCCLIFSRVPWKQKMASQPLVGRHSTSQEQHLLTARSARFTPAQGSAPGSALGIEEELLYLTFIEEVTNEILRFGIFSNRYVTVVFSFGKMRQMLEVLKSDLGCDQDSDTEQIHADQEASGPVEQHKCGTTEEPEFDSKGHRSRETQGKEDFSEDTTEIMGAGKESDFHGVVFEEHPDTSPTCEAASNLCGCDCDFDTNKELDELDGNFAEALHISPKYS
uniref:Uncharacterized protein n=1 Tax=Zonotrichia albicollis TaxID=44394 RepID=A0A8D2QB68_ZONAL